MLPLISFIVPCYNADKYIQDCIDSVLAQSLQEWELLLIDDGSTDLTARICQDAQKNDHRIKYIHQENKGVSFARNKGLEIAKGEYISCIDADDWIEPNFIESFKKAHLADINICGYREIWPNGDEKSHYSPNDLYCNNPLDTYTVRNSSFRTPWAVVIRRQFLTDHRLQFNENLSWGEDTMFMLHATKDATDICFISNVVYDYRFTGTGLTNSPKRHRNIVQFLDAYLLERKEMTHRSKNAQIMMNELILFIAVILLKEVFYSSTTKDDKINYIASIHHYFKNIPLLFTIKTKVGRIRYITALCSRIFSSHTSYNLYKKIL